MHVDFCLVSLTFINTIVNFVPPSFLAFIKSTLSLALLEWLKKKATSDDNDNSSNKIDNNNSFGWGYKKTSNDLVSISPFPCKDYRVFRKQYYDHLKSSAWEVISGDRI